jgi:hypothetical protein
MANSTQAEKSLPGESVRSNRAVLADIPENNEHRDALRVKVHQLRQENRPPGASSNRPTRRCTAPVKAPGSWPNSSEEISDGASAAQFTLTICGTICWMARAMSSLPVPVSPVIRATGCCNRDRGCARQRAAMNTSGQTEDEVSSLPKRTLIPTSTHR